jgi:hypothetical protein
MDCNKDKLKQNKKTNRGCNIVVPLYTPVNEVRVDCKTLVICFQIEDQENFCFFFAPFC